MMKEIIDMKCNCVRENSEQICFFSYFRVLACMLLSAFLLTGCVGSHNAEEGILTEAETEKMEQRSTEGVMTNQEMFQRERKANQEMPRREQTTEQERLLRKKVNQEMLYQGQLGNRAIFYWKTTRKMPIGVLRQSRRSWTQTGQSILTA